MANGGLEVVKVSRATRRSASARVGQKITTGSGSLRSSGTPYPWLRGRRFTG